MKEHTIGITLNYIEKIILISFINLYKLHEDISILLLLISYWCQDICPHLNYSWSGNKVNHS